MPRVADYDETGADAPGGRGPRAPKHWCGSEPQNIPNGSEVTFIFSPNMDMTPEQLVIPDIHAPSVAVVGASIGPISISAGDGPFPGDAFKASSEIRFLPAVGVTQNQPMRVRVKNMTSAPLTGVYLGIIGRVTRAS